MDARAGRSPGEYKVVATPGEIELNLYKVEVVVGGHDVSLNM